MNIQLDRSRPVPLARQIEEQIERLIQERLLGPGVKLPATRELADTLGVNRATVALAYEELVAAGLARAHVGQGTFVTGRPEAVVAAPVRSAASIDWSGLFSRNAQIIGADEERRRAAGVPATLEGDVVSFAGGMPDSGLFPTDAFRRVLNGVIRDEGA
jgi:GntR family transcriptional regulator/MocR family aminotransferase